MKSRALKRFLKYTVIGVSTFAFDLALLYLFTDLFAWHYIISTGAAFTVAISVNYFLSRKYVFKGTLKSIGKGYIAFMSIACLGVFLAMAGMELFVGILHFEFLHSRVIIAAIVGIWNYLMNLYVNFKVGDK
jgi:putative flippase GtrA